MEYSLSQKNDNKKRQYEKMIEQNNKKYFKLVEEIQKIRLSKEGTVQDRKFAILELEIQKEEIENDTSVKEQSIADLYFREMEENLTQRARNKEITPQEFTNETKNIREYRQMINNKNFIEENSKESIILEMKKRLEYMKKSMGKISKEQADRNIAKIEQTISENAEHNRIEIENLAKQNFEYKRRNLYYQRNSGKISTDELKQKLEELEQTKRYIPTDKEFEEILNDLSEKHLKQPQQSQEYERKVSNRDSINNLHYWEQISNQDINKSHEDSVYQNIAEIANFQYSLQEDPWWKTHEEYVKCVVGKLGKEYARGAKAEKAELAKQFAMLEVEGKTGDFLDLYNSEETNGYDNPKLLLQLEKVDGLNIKELALNQDVFVATYEIEEWDSNFKKRVMKPIKEYYHKNENGNLEIIGTGTEKNTKFVIDGNEINLQTDKVLQGKLLEKVTQKEMADRFIKNGIEDSLKNGKVTEVAQLTDMIFLEDFKEQCGISKDENLFGRTFIVSTINEKGEEDFDILIRTDDINGTYEHITGINTTKKSGREMYTTNGTQLLGGSKVLNKTNTLKEFVTKSGHRYSITRNKDGKLGFNEIVKENENIIMGEHIDAYTYSTDDLISTYTNTEINQEDLNKAYEILNRTKEKREQTHNETKTKNFEGR